MSAVFYNCYLGLLRAITCCSVVFGTTLRLFVIYTLHRRLPPSTHSAAYHRLVSSTRNGYCTCRCKHTQHTTEPDIGSESRFLPTPCVFDAPVRGGPRRNIAMTFGTEKLEWRGYPMMKKICRSVYSFWRNSWKWQLDTQTPHDGRGHACIASRSKKWNKYLQRITNNRHIIIIIINRQVMMTMKMTGSTCMCTSVSGTATTDVVLSCSVYKHTKTSFTPTAASHKLQICNNFVSLYSQCP